MIYHMAQYSEEWWRLRIGKNTASMQWAVDKWNSTQTSDKDPLRKKREVLVETAKGPKLISVAESSDRQSYRNRIVAQILCGYQGEGDEERKEWKGKFVEWGEEFEKTAIAQYEVANACVVSKVGFVTHDEIEGFGCSPDCLVGTDGIAQIKCPATTTHIVYRDRGIVPEEYEPQLVAEMACTGRKWADFVSFDPRMLDESLRLFVVRLLRDEKRIQEVEDAVKAFRAEVWTTIAKLTGKEPNLEEQLRQSLEQLREPLEVA